MIGVSTSGAGRGAWCEYDWCEYDWNWTGSAIDVLLRMLGLFCGSTLCGGGPHRHFHRHHHRHRHRRRHHTIAYLICLFVLRCRCPSFPPPCCDWQAARLKRDELALRVRVMRGNRQKDAKKAADQLKNRRQASPPLLCTTPLHHSSAPLCSALLE